MQKHQPKSRNSTGHHTHTHKYTLTYIRVAHMTHPYCLDTPGEDNKHSQQKTLSMCTVGALYDVPQYPTECTTTPIPLHVTKL